MPATLADLFTIEQMRAEMRLPDVVDAEVDMLLPGFFEAAISWITERTRYPILNQTRTVFLRMYFVQEPIVIPFSFLSSVDAIHYWTPSSSLNQDSDGTIASPGRLQKEANYALQYPPDDGWPTVLSDSTFQFNVIRGVADIPKGLRHAIVLLAADLFNGAPEIKPTASLLILISPFEAYLNAG